MHARDRQPDRRQFLIATALLAGDAPFRLPSAQRLDAAKSQEVPTYWMDVPPKTTFWGTVAFLGDDFVEVTLATPQQSKALRGRFDGQRLAEFSWRNASPEVQRLAVRATAVATKRELTGGPVQYLGSGLLYVAFGRRATPANAADRHGAYPHEAVLVGFVLYGE